MHRQVDHNLSEQLNSWIEAYGKSYVAHAIWKENVDSALMEGEIKPAEAILRQCGIVSYEAGSTYGDRGTKDIRHLLTSFRKNPPSIPYRIEKLNGMSIAEACKFGFLDINQALSFMDIHEVGEQAFFPLYDLFFGNKTVTCPLSKETFLAMSEEEKQKQVVTLKDGKNYTIILTRDSLKSDSSQYVFKIEELPSLHDHYIFCGDANGLSYIEHLDGLCKEYQVSDDAIQIAVDCIAAEPIDKKLSYVWDTYSKLTEKENHKKIFFQLFHYRNNEIRITKLNNNVRASYCRVWWNYGDVAVLRGNPEAIISIANQDERSNKKDSLCKGQEVCLLQPLENHGEFFSLDLRREDTIVIGPERVLSQYRRLSECQGIRLFDFESMDEEQLDFFQVPEMLRPEKEAFEAKEKRLSQSAAPQHPASHIQPQGYVTQMPGTLFSVKPEPNPAPEKNLQSRFEIRTSGTVM